MRISDWSSDVCSSDLKKLKIMARISLQGMVINLALFTGLFAMTPVAHSQPSNVPLSLRISDKSVLETFLIIEHQTSYTFAYFSSGLDLEQKISLRSEEHTSELQSLMRISYAVF